MTAAEASIPTIAVDRRHGSRQTKMGISDE